MDPKDIVSAFEAKTHLSELLRETERGHAYTIERRGKPVARLLPPAPAAGPRNLRKIAAALGELRRRIARRGRKVNIRELIEEGRRV